MQVLFLFFVAFIGLTNAQRPRDCFGEGTLTQENRDVVLRGAEEFGLGVFRNIALNFSTKSFVLSPSSVYGVMKLSYFGAAGSTERELQNALGAPSKRDAYWVSQLLETEQELAKKINPSLVTISQLNRAYFADDIQVKECAFGKIVDLERVNFANGDAAAFKINGDIEKATRGEISNFLNAGLVQDARYILVNAVYFKGKWVEQFDKSRTKDAPFFGEDKQKMKTPARMMEARAKFPYTQYDPLQVEVVNLPYNSSSISMMILLPNEGTKLDTLLERLTEGHLQQITNNLRTSAQVTVNLPAFNFTTKLNSHLKKSLIQAGIRSLFSPTNADLSNYSPNEKLYVDSTLHQATIRVDEEGTVASGVTALVITRTGVEKQVAFNANRPFLFLIRDNDVGHSHFAGVYRNPAHSRAN